MWSVKPLMRHRLARVAVTSVLLLPSSCAAGNMAALMWGQRMDHDVSGATSIWAENLLWLSAIAIVLWWGWLVDRFWKSGETK